MATAVFTNWNWNTATNTQTGTVRISHKGVDIDLTVPISPQAISQADQLREVQDWLRDFGQDLTSVVVSSPLVKNDAVVKSIDVLVMEAIS
jgi:hypothetical protein